ncbi:hypothetical protein YC2023_038258 [Brassica napus]
MLKLFVFIFSKCVSDGATRLSTRLVLALGAEPKLDLVPGAMEFALPFYTLNDAIVRVGLFYFLNCRTLFSSKAWLLLQCHWQRVNEKLSKLERRNFKNGNPIKVAVVGCGYGGVELAATISVLSVSLSEFGNFSFDGEIGNAHS